LGFAACGGGGGGGDSGSQLSCGDGTTKENGKCVSENPNDGNDGNQTTCGEGTTQNDSGECVPSGESVTCGSGTIAQNGECVVGEDGCGPNATPEDGKCVPTEGVCSDGTSWNADQGQCVATVSCGDKTQNDEGTCVPDLQAVCSAMGAAVQPDTDNGTCVVDFDEACADGTSQDGQKCVPDATCQQGDVVVNGQCASPAEQLAANADVTESENNDPNFGGSANELQFQNNDAVSFTGTIEAPRDIDGESGTEQDVDVYTFSASQAGQWFKMTLQSTGSASIAFTVEGPEGSEWTRLGSITDSAPVREFVAPASGDYTVRVQPTRTLVNEEIGPVGGQDWGYAGELEKIQAPSPSQVDLTSSQATGSVSKTTDNLFDVQGFQGGDLVELTADTVGDDVSEMVIELWSGSNRVISTTVEEGDTVTIPFPQTSSGNSINLLVDATAVLGPSDDFAISGSTVSNAENIGSINADGQQQSSARTIQDGNTYYYTFTASGGEVLEISHTNGEDEDVDIELSKAGQVLLEDLGFPVADDLDTDEGYYFTETGGSFLLKVDANDGKVSNFQLTVNSLTPASLGSGQPGDTLSTTINDTVEEDRSGFATLMVTAKAGVTTTLAPVSSNTTENDIYVYPGSTYDTDDELYAEFGDSSGENEVVADASNMVHESGLYVIRIDGDAQLQEYKLTSELTQPPIEESEPNNSRSNATAATLGRNHVGTSASDGNDPDFFKVTLQNDLPAQELLKVNVQGEAGEYECALVDSSGNNLVTRSGFIDGCVLMGQGLTAGDYFVKVVNQDSFSDVDYTVTPTTESGTLESEPNDSQSNATSIGGQNLPSATQKMAYGSLSLSNATDVFSFKVDSKINGALAPTIQLIGPDPPDIDDVDWTVMDSNQNTVISKSGTRVTQGLGSGTYYLEVSADSSDLEDFGGDPYNGAYRVDLATFIPDKTKNKQPGASFPDKDSQGVTSSASVSGCSTVQGVALGLDISHTEANDIAVELTNTATGDSIDVLVKDTAEFTDFGSRLYPLTHSPAESFSTFTGKSGSGSWEIQVADVDDDGGQGQSGGEGGTFNSWTLHLQCN
jgi:subtilisin-like proprotein convertase family protein